MKTFKKVLASTLAAAMVVTALPVTPANAVAAPKLSATKATLYVGQSKAIKITTPSTWKSVKTTVSSSKKSVATVKKNSTKKFTVKAVKAGTAKVTVKVTARKSNKKVSKTLKATIKVKNPTLNVTASKTTLNVGETAQLKVTKNPSSSVVKYSSTDAAVATVSAGKVKAIAPGTAYVVVSSTYGKKTITKKIKITVKATKDGLTSTLTNDFSSEYANTVLVGDAAIINVVYAKDGKPVSGETVVMNITGGTEADSHYEVKGNNTAVTNASGVATFVIGNKNSVKSSATAEVASVNYKVQVPAAGVASEATVNFAAITNKAITDVNNHNTITTDDLVPGTNYTAANVGIGCTKTTSMDKADKDKTFDQQADNVEYVESQQVSSTGNKEHEVTMTGGYPMIYLPGSSSTVDNATKMTDEINQSSKKYNTYANDSYYYELKEDPNKLTYATLNFDKVTLSKYTRLVVETFKDKKAAEDSKNPGETNNGSIDQKIYDGEMAQSSIGYQIPLGSGYAKLCVKVTLQSAGQVDMAKNDGYTAKNVVYVYKTQKTTGWTSVPLKNATVDWTIAATPYTAETAVDSVNGVTKKDPADTLTAKLPVFPYTGTAIITEYDSNNKVVAYYAVATCNNGKNQNIINTNKKAYQISSDELRDKVGEIVSQNGTSVTVDSKQSGRMTLEGTVKVDGKVIEDAELASVYTSVQWNPIPKTTTTDSDAFVALLGQKIEVVAQLTDKNGNAVSESGHGITFKSTKLGTRNNTNTPDSVAADEGKVTVVNQLAAKTDANGQSKMILKASAIAELLNVKAESADSQYDAKLVIAGKSTDSADLYWVDANLYFKDKVQTGYKEVTTSAISPAAVTAGMDIEPDAGSTWMYGVQTKGTKAKNGKLKGKEIEINGLGITMSKSSSSVGTIESLADVKGAVKATSTKGGEMDIISKIDATTLTKDVTVSEGTFAGTGATSINKKLTISVIWKAAGLTASYVNPTGTRTTAGTKDVYLKVTDSYGNAVSGSAVTFKAADGTVSGTPVKTDANGIAKATVTKGTTTTTTVSATVDGISTDTFDQTIVWVNAADVKTLAIDDGKNADDSFVTNYDKDKKTVTLTFNDDVVASSVVKELFTVTYKGQSTVNQLVVKSVAVNDNVVTLTLADVPSLVDARDKVEVEIKADTVKSVEYTLTSLAGSSYNNKKVTISLNGTTKPSEQ